MKWLLNIPILLASQLFFLQLAAQKQDNDPCILAKELTTSCKTDLQKVKVIFNWITENISYRTTSVYRKNNASLDYSQPGDDDTIALKPLNERVAETVLKRRTGVCEGYARLFATLCEFAGVRSELISGYAKGGPTRLGRFGPNHYWNAVYLDSAWHLLDATWASGYVSWQGDEFIKSYDGRYFLTSPEVFIQDHYPDDIRWALMHDAPLPKEFSYSPFKQKSFTKYKITSYYPKSGVIEVAIGDTIHLGFETADVNYDQQICPDLLIDSTIFSYSPSWIFLKPVFAGTSSSNPHKLKYTYVVTSPDTEWLYLMYNDDLILRYKIKMKKEMAKN